jgi:putative membrane protein
VELSDLPAVNACLNGASAVLLTLGYIYIKRGAKDAHRNCMVGAVMTSTFFLACYLVYHYFAGRTIFRNPEWFRPIYLLILLTHTILAVLIVPMVLTTVVLAIRQHWESHKRIARWTWPIWMYVSITGVLIYLLLYRIFPQR